MITVFIDIALRLLAVVGICLALMDVIGSSLYDLRETKRRRQYALHPHARRYRVRPLISIIVLTRNSEASIVSCLKSVLKSSYHNIEIIVADNASRDDTKRLVRSFQAAHPSHSVKLFAKRRLGNANRVAREAYKAYGRGEIILTIQSSALLDKQALRRAIDRFNSEPGLGSLGARQSVQVGYNGYGLTQKYQELLNQRLHKCASVFGAYTPEQSVVLRRREVFERPARSFRGARSHREAAGVAYASDVVIHVSAQQTLGRLVRNYLGSQRWHLRNLWSRGFRRGTTTLSVGFWLLFATSVEAAMLLSPLVLTYFAYLAVRLHEPTLLVVSAALLSLFLGFAIWGDEQLHRSQKLGYILGIPLTYGLFYLLSFARYMAVLSLAIPKYYLRES